MSVTLESGWICVPYSGHDLAQIYISVGDQDDWRPAFLDWVDAQRVAKIRPTGISGKSLKVWLKVNEHVTYVGKVVL